jgi:hypothetical protein
MNEFLSHSEDIRKATIKTTVRYSFLDVVNNTAEIKFADLGAASDKRWGQTTIGENNDICIELNARFLAFLEGGAKAWQSEADRDLFLLQLAITVMHELAHAYVRYPEAKGLASEKYLRGNGRTPLKLLKHFGLRDIGTVLEYAVFEMMVCTDGPLSLYAGEIQDNGFFADTSSYALFIHVCLSSVLTLQVRKSVPGLFSSQ